MSRNPRIKFYCRSFNKELYLLSRGLYEQAGYPCVRLTDQTADGYFFKMLEDETCDIAINVDEDCFISNLDAVLKLAKRVEEEKWINAGCSDAGAGVPRKGDPTVTNPFFNVFNLHEIRKSWNAYRLIPQLKKDSYKGIEPYYNFFHWLVETFPGRTLYLNNCRHHDTITTRLFDDTEGGVEICQHTWFARLFKISIFTRLFEGNDRKDVNHQRRINNIIEGVYFTRGISRPSFNMIDQMDFSIDEFQRWCIKIPQRIANWPNKLKRKFA